MNMICPFCSKTNEQKVGEKEETKKARKMEIFCSYMSGAMSVHYADGPEIWSLQNLGSFFSIILQLYDVPSAVPIVSMQL